MSGTEKALASIVIVLLCCGIFIGIDCGFGNTETLQGTVIGKLYTPERV